MKPVIQSLLIVVGSLLIGDTLLVAPRVRFNSGVILPAILGLPLLLWGIFYQMLQETATKGFFSSIKWLLVMGYSLFILTFGWVTVRVVRASQGTIPPDAAVLIVLGASLRGSQVSRTLKLRLDKAADVLRSHPDLAVIVSGGRGPGEAIPESAAMALYLIEKGITPERIRIEDRSANTFENFTFSRPLVLEAAGQDDPLTVIVTSRTHLYRAMKIAGQVGYRMAGAGAPEPWYLITNSLLREYLAVLKHHWLGY